MTTQEEGGGMTMVNKPLRALDLLERQFLSAIKREGSQVSAAHLPMADRASDAARSRLKRLGLVRFDRAEWAWFRTPAGDIALSEEGKKR